MTYEIGMTAAIYSVSFIRSNQTPMFSALKKTLVAAIGLASMALAQAATVHIKFDDYIFNGMSGSGYDATAITYTNPNGSKTTEWAAAGRFQGTASNLQGIAPGTFIDSVDNVYMYCYDVFQAINHGSSVDYSVNFTGATQRTLDFLGAVNYVLNGNTNAWTDKFAWLHVSNQYVGAAIQIGIWETLYDTSWNLAGGSFAATGFSNTTLGYLNQFSTALANSNVKDLAAADTMTLVSPFVQDMITGDPPVDVPEPGSLALIGLALASLGIARRRQQKNA
jgi:hypothetical protein